MKLTSYSDYALRTLMFLSVMPKNELATIAQVSQMYSISKNHLIKIVAQLASLGYIDTVRGKSGGIRLAKMPNEINLGELIRHIETGLQGIDCQAQPCLISGHCHLKGILMEAMDAFLTTLDRYTLADTLKNESELKVIFDL